MTHMTQMLPVPAVPEYSFQAGHRLPASVIRLMYYRFKTLFIMTRRELALQYFPGTDPKRAVRRLTAWIRGCDELYARLTANGQTFDRRHPLTIREVKLIYYYLGEP